MKKIVIAIDGPAGSGKSTVARILSLRYGVYYLDTGAMYRAVAYQVIQKNIDISNKDELYPFLKDLKMKIEFVDNSQRTIVDCIDVSQLIRTEEVSQKASDVAVVPEIRLKLVELQRAFSYNNGGIIDGRDIGTYVLPDADFKFYLTASLEERARRRLNEYLLKGENADYNKMIEKISARDAQDMQREFAPLKKADTAIEIDTTGKNIDEVVEQIIKVIENGNNIL